MDKEFLFTKVMGRLEYALFRSTACETIRPLVERASVSDKLKKPILDLAESGGSVAFDRLAKEVGAASEEHREMLRRALKQLVVAERAIESAKGFYRTFGKGPDLSLHEAREVCQVLLARWPAAARRAIIDVFKDDDAKGKK